MSNDQKPIADRFRDKIAEIGPQEALRRLRLALEPTEEEIMADVEAFNAELRAKGIDPEAWNARMVAEITEKLKTRKA